MPAIRVENLSQGYAIGGGETARENCRGKLTRSLSSRFRRLQRKGCPVATKERYRVLKDVRFEWTEGEAVGIIARNDAGKSTQLKVLSRVTAPTDGRVEPRGRVSSLLEVGTGFHPEPAGRENVFLNGPIFGMRNAIE